MQDRLVLGLIGIVLALVGCGEKPVKCADFKLESGSRPSITTFAKPNDRHVWSQCSDGKTRVVTCTTAHTSKWKCLCQIDNIDKIESRQEVDFPDDRNGATFAANQMCHWKLE